MPLLSPWRQAVPVTCQWFQQPAVIRLVGAAHCQTLPELAHVFGREGLFLCASKALTASLPGNRLGHVASLYREMHGLSGTVRCQDGALPFQSGSQSLVYASFILESATDSTALLAEMARVLRPDGVLLLLTLNPWSPLRLQWSGQGIASLSARRWADRVHQVGLTVERQRTLGPFWSAAADHVRMLDDESGGVLDGLRMAALTVARRQEAGIMPQRWASSLVGLGQGVRANGCVMQNMPPASAGYSRMPAKEGSDEKSS